jgi:probable addiction module antidote protein
MSKSRAYNESLDEVLRNPTDAAAYLNVALEEEDQEGFLLALRNVANAHNVSEVARLAGINRVTMYKILSEDGNPTVRTLDAVLHAMGLKLVIAPDDRA